MTTRLRSISLWLNSRSLVLRIDLNWFALCLFFWVRKTCCSLMNGSFLLRFLLKVICAIKNSFSVFGLLISLCSCLILHWKVICAIKNYFSEFGLFISWWFFVFHFSWIRFRRDNGDTLHVTSLVWSVFKLNSNCLTFCNCVWDYCVFKRGSLFCFGLGNKCGLTCINLLFHFINFKRAII